MKRKQLTEIRNKNVSDLSKTLTDKKLDLVKALAEARVTGDKNVKKARGLRDEIAKISTIIREKQLIEQNDVNA